MSCQESQPAEELRYNILFRTAAAMALICLTVEGWGGVQSLWQWGPGDGLLNG